MTPLGDGRGRRVTVLDIARDAGVSKSTVSLVLQDSPRIPAKTKQSVRASMRRLGYVYHRGAANMRSGRSNSIGVVINDLTNPFFASLFAGIGEEVGRQGYVTLLTDNRDDAAVQGTLVKRFLEHNVDGLIVSPAVRSDVEELERLSTPRAPILLSLRNLPGSVLDFVGSDFSLGAQLAVRHLLRLGHTDLAFVGRLSDTYSSDAKLLGFERGFALVTTPPRRIDCENTRRGGFDAARLVIDDGRITACLCFNDLVAFGLMAGLRSRGRSVPEDVSVVGFDGLPEGELSEPTLTSVSVDPVAIGRRAGAQLLQRMAEPDTAAQSVVIAPVLKEARSTGSPRREPDEGGGSVRDDSS